jgi:hypothetical protein
MRYAAIIISQGIENVQIWEIVFGRTFVAGFYGYG